MKLHEKLAKLCAKKRWGQSDLIDAVGDVSKSTMNNWFNGKTKPDIDSALRMARALDVTLDYLADDDADEGLQPWEMSEGERILINMFRRSGMSVDDALTGMMKQSFVSPSKNTEMMRRGERALREFEEQAFRDEPERLASLTEARQIGEDDLTESWSRRMREAKAANKKRLAKEKTKRKDEPADPKK